MFALLLLTAAGFYAALIAYFAVGFRRVRRASVPEIEAESLPTVSVVVAARNEARTIEACVRSILANAYPPGRLEVIVVDDGSTDGTADRVERLRTAVPFRLVRLRGPQAGRGKRAALDAGIAQARGEIILTTDADCTVGPGWVGAMAACFTPETGFVAGPVRYRPGPTLFGRFQALEFLALIATGAGGIGMGRPNMCNGANVAYRRALAARFRDPQDGRSPASDEVLAQRLARETSWRVRFCAAPAALVETEPVLDVQAFWAQRRRWAGTGPRYPRRRLVAAILGVYAFYVLLLGGLAAAFAVPGLWGPVLAALGLKVGAEVALLWPACRHFGQPWLFRYYLPELPFQILYVVLVGVGAAVARPAWKGRPAFR
ncbi:MAG: glycosyltransferase [Rhodothermales bacterium]|nr:glycosyltransferase [Rhodothermales bacterium]